MSTWSHVVRRQGARSLRAGRLLRPRVSLIVDESSLASARRATGPVEIVSSDPCARAEDWRVHLGKPRGRYVVRLAPGDKLLPSGLTKALALDADVVFRPEGGSLLRRDVPLAEALREARTVVTAPEPIVRPAEPRPRTGVFGAMYDSRPRLQPFLAQQYDGPHRGLWQQAAWYSDVQWFVQDAERLDHDQWTAVRTWVASAQLPDLPVEQRARVWLTRQDDRAGLEKLIADLRFEQGHFPTELIDGRAHAVLPVAVPDEVRALTAAETKLVLHVHRAGQDGVELFAYVRGVDLTQATPTVTVNGVPATVEFSREVTRHARTRHVNHDLGLVKVAAAGRLEVSVEVAGYTRTGSVHVDPDSEYDDVVPDSPLADDERGPYCQARLQEEYAASTVLKEQAYFQSYPGRTATDSPLAIHQHLQGIPTVWAVADSSVQTPAGAERVLWRSRAWYAALAQSRYLVTNIEPEPFFRLKPGQRLLQTFHGFPSKTMGIGLWESKEWTRSRIEQQLDRTSRNWSLLLTPTPEMDRHYREQYLYEGPILNQGYPRDDVLVSPEAAAIRETTRRRLGLGDRTAILYAPTWRDDLATNFRAASAVDHLDVERAAARLGPGYVLLLRGHRFTASAVSRKQGAGIVDVTDYPEINDLILAADAAVLDYSSLRFDFALTGKPMVFLVPDLAAYAGATRGFLYDFEPTAPGPLLDTSDEVIEALQDLPGIRRQYAQAYATFNERFSYTQDGHASERAVRAFFGESRVKPDVGR